MYDIGIFESQAAKLLVTNCFDLKHETLVGCESSGSHLCLAINSGERADYGERADNINTNYRRLGRSAERAVMLTSASL